MSNLNELKPTSSLSPFGKFCCTIGHLPSSYMSSLTYEEQLLWFCDYLQNTVIPAVNNNAECVKELQELYVKLKNYVDNYFENLDVQNEINTKLDEMAESGELQNIISAFLKLNSLISFNNVEDMKNSQNLIDGSFAQTLGFYKYNDGGSGTYKIREIQNTDVVDNCTIIPLSFNNLIAELIIENSTISVNQFGAHGNGLDDDTIAIQKCIDYCTSNNLTCFFNNQIYLTTSPLEIKEVSVLSGGVTNDEYNTQARIKNTTSDMITISSNIVGAKIKNLCFESDISKELYFLNNTDYALEWCEISNCGFRKFYKVFNCATLGCKFEKLWINYGKSMGILTGSDNTIKDCFIGTPLAGVNDDLLVLDGYSLSRLENLYFTGKVDNNTGCNNIVKIEGYSTNLQFDGCFFDFSNGSAINILGQGGDFPRSGATNISYNNCLFRGNCCNQNTITHIINADYCRNLNIINCSFMNQDRYSVNENSKIYNFGQYSQGVMLFNNYYETPYSSNTIYINNASIIEPYGIQKFNNIGINYYSDTLFLKTSTKNKKIFTLRNTYTTGSTYGEITIPLPEDMGDNPVVSVTASSNPNLVITVNQITSNTIQLIAKKLTDGQPVLSKDVDVSVIITN